MIELKWKRRNKKAFGGMVLVSEAPYGPFWFRIHRTKDDDYKYAWDTNFNFGNAYYTLGDDEGSGVKEKSIKTAQRVIGDALNQFADEFEKARSDNG